MEKLLKILVLLLFSQIVHANGVGIVDATNGVYFTLVSSEVTATVENQIAIVKARQVMRNDLGVNYPVKYAFPLPPGASATELRWKIGEQWYLANISATPQDTTLPGPGNNPSQALLDYLGDEPLYFNFPQVVKADSQIIVEISYVQFLPYAFGDVDFTYPNNYQAIQQATLDRQFLDLTLNSARTINSISVLSGHQVNTLTNNGSTAVVQIDLPDQPADDDYRIQYALDLNQLGLFSFSTSIADSLLPDTLGGFFSFVVEPQPDPGTVIEKYFTLIIDRSGSMSGDKIVQAKDAAGFIVNNLNDADFFNIVDFSTATTSFRTEHVAYTPQTQSEALTYISSINAGGGTNIQRAFDTAIPQFNNASDSTANIVIFFTDGQANGGISNTIQLSDYVRNLNVTTGKEVAIFTFGIGASVNQQLLTLLAVQNDGLAEFLGDDEVFARITDFYRKIRNPVLLDTELNFLPAIVNEVYPDPLPNLYAGQQMIVSGRYSQAANVAVTLSGQAFGQPVSYQYDMLLADTTVSNYSFLTKVWAKSKIEKLMIDYLSLSPTTPQAQLLKEEIISLSVQYGVISPFTRFSGGNPTGIEDDDVPVGTSQTFALLGNYPNPFNPQTAIRVQVVERIAGPMTIRIYNSLGQLVRILTIMVSGNGLYEVIWDGRDASGASVASGTYFYMVEMKNTVLAGKMILQK